MEASDVCSRARHRSSRVAAHRISDFSQFHSLGWNKISQMGGEDVGSVTENIVQVYPNMADNVEAGDIEVTLGVGTGSQAGGAGSCNASRVRITVQQSQGLDSTVSNFYLGEGEVGSESWKVKKAEMTLKLQCAKE